jgi:replication fork protection complex subunit Tof1/Swi1
MLQDDAISISSNDADSEAYAERRAILEPVISRVIDALGGYEDGTYRLGDEVNGCLKDLKKLWRKDDTDDERTVARIFWESRVLPNDLIPILLETAGKGLVEDKRAVACADLITAMTWPIDIAEELKELDDELDRGTDYTQLLQSHLHYKAALLKPGVVQALFAIVLPPLAKHPKERQERDGQVINVVLHLIRNLAFIKDLPPNMHLSADQAEFSSLQSKLIRTLSDTHTLQLLLTIAANTSNDPLFNSWNTLVLEIFYLLYRGVKPASLTMDQAEVREILPVLTSTTEEYQQPAANLHRLLAIEERSRRDFARNATSRHSRFGTTISVKWNPNKLRPTDATRNEVVNTDPVTAPAQSVVLHRQKAITDEAGSIMDLTKRQKTKKGNKVDDIAREDNLSVETKVILQNLAGEFIESCFNR